MFTSKMVTMNQNDVVRRIHETAARYGVRGELAVAVARRESSLNPAVSDGGVGEIGLFQVRPSTAADFGYTAAALRDPEKNIDAGVRYLAWLLQQTGGDELTALQAYNGGIGNVRRGQVSSAAKSYAVAVLADARRMAGTDVPLVVATVPLLPVNVSGAEIAFGVVVIAAGFLLLS